MFDLLKCVHIFMSAPLVAEASSQGGVNSSEGIKIPRIYTLQTISRAAFGSKDTFTRGEDVSYRNRIKRVAL